MAIGAFNFTRFATISSSSLHPYTQDYITRLNAVSGNISNARTLLIDSYLRGLITDGLIDETTISNSLLRYQILFATSSFIGCNVPLIDAMNVGNASLVNFVSSDYSTDGLTGDGSSKYCNTNFVPINHLISVSDGGSFGVYSSSGTIGSSFFAYGSKNSPNNSFLMFGSSDYQGAEMFDVSGSHRTFVLTSYTHGFNYVYRKSDGFLTQKRNSTLIANSAEASAGNLSSTNFLFFAYSETEVIVPSGFNNHTVRTGIIGRGLTDTQASSMNSRIQTLIAGM